MVQLGTLLPVLRWRCRGRIGQPGRAIHTVPHEPRIASCASTAPRGALEMTWRLYTWAMQSRCCNRRGFGVGFSRIYRLRFDRLLCRRRASVPTSLIRAIPRLFYSSGDSVQLHTSELDVVRASPRLKSRAKLG